MGIIVNVIHLALQRHFIGVPYLQPILDLEYKNAADAFIESIGSPQRHVGRILVMPSDLAQSGLQLKYSQTKTLKMDELILVGPNDLHLNRGQLNR